MSCKVVISDSQGIYQPGETIYGLLICTFNARESIRGIKARLRGREHTEWVERESYYDDEAKETKYRDVDYVGDNKFLSLETILVGEKTMSPGRYEYTFEFKIPKNIPSTFRGSYGFVKYYIQGLVDIPFAFDYEDEKYFRVHAPIDFNEIRSTLKLDPCTYQDEKTICCCFCASGPITLDVHLQKEAFVLGEVAKVKIDVTNLSNVNIDKLFVKMKTTLQSETTSPRTSYKYEAEILASESETGVGAHGQRTYEFDLEIPNSASVFNFKRCSLFSQWCVLKIKAVLPEYHSNMEVETLLDIGHIPIRDVPPTQQTSHQQSSQQVPSGPSPPPSQDQPPSYSASADAPPYPNAPPEETAPSAPPKAKMAEGDDFVSPDGQGPSGGSSEPPPPTYNDAVNEPSVPPPSSSKPSGASASGAKPSGSKPSGAKSSGAKPTAPPESQNGNFHYSTNRSQRIERGENGDTVVTTFTFYSAKTKEL